jgi:intracellular sulfur oxidation DsrE/DsrF family protein
MRFLFAASLALWLGLASSVQAEGRRVATPYAPAKAVFEMYLDDPAKLGSALYWVRALLNPLLEAPYGYAPEELRIVVVLHGTEIVTVARNNEARYQDVVERMRYYASLGIAFKVCGEAAADYGYAPKDFQDFIEVVPNAIAELVHWQQQGYSIITPQVLSKQFSVEGIR